MLPPLVDAHAHLFTADMPHIPNPRHRITYDFTTEQYLEILDRHGVRFAVIAAASPYGDYNDYTIEATRRHPRLRGTVIVEPTVERYVLERMKADGIVGVRLPFVSLTELPDITSFDWQRTLRRFRDLDWHVHLHLDGPRLPLVMDTLVASGVKLVIDHFGRPDPAKGIRCEGFQSMLRAIDKGNCWVKVSGGYRLGAERAALYGWELLRVAGADRLIWASDCPFVGHEKDTSFQETIDVVADWCTDPADRQKVFGETAMKLFFS